MSIWNRTSLLGGVAVVVLGALGTGCGSSAASLCADFCDCTGCSDSEQEDCVDDLEDLEKSAEDEGCGDQIDDLYSCWDDQLRCTDSRVDLDGCDSEEKSFGNCADVGVSSGRGNSSGPSEPAPRDDEVSENPESSGGSE